MKYWETIADNLARAGWSYGYGSYIQAFVGKMWVVEAHKDGKRFIVRADDLLTAFLELETQCRGARGATSAEGAAER